MIDRQSLCLRLHALEQYATELEVVFAEAVWVGATKALGCLWALW
jgi:hypothetical protein